MCHNSIFLFAYTYFDYFLLFVLFFAAGFFSAGFFTATFFAAGFLTGASSFLTVGFFAFFLPFVVSSATTTSVGFASAFFGAAFFGALTPLMLMISTSVKFWRCPFLTL